MERKGPKCAQAKHLEGEEVGRCADFNPGDMKRGEQTSPNAVKKVGASIDKYLIRSEKFGDALDAWIFANILAPRTGNRLNRPSI